MQTIYGDPERYKATKPRIFLNILACILCGRWSSPRLERFLLDLGVSMM